MVIFFFQHPFHVTLMSLFRDQFEVSHHENHTFGNCHDCYHTPEPILLPNPYPITLPKIRAVRIKKTRMFHPQIYYGKIVLRYRQIGDYFSRPVSQQSTP